MERLFELYEMVSMNSSALREAERLTILKAQAALQMFEEAMASFSLESSQTPADPGTCDEYTDIYEVAYPAAAVLHD